MARQYSLLIKISLSAFCCFSTNSAAYSTTPPPNAFPRHNIRNFRGPEAKVKFESTEKEYKENSQSELLSYSYWILLAARGKSQEADKLAREAMVKHPDWCAPDLLLGKMAEDAMEDDIALNHYNKVLTLRPHCSNALEARGMQYKDRNKYDFAIRDLSEAMKYCEPEYAGILRVERIKIYALANMNDKALADCKVILEKNPGNGIVRECKARVLLKLKRWQEVVNETSYQINKGLPVTHPHIYRAEAEMELHKYNDVVKDCTIFLSRSATGSDFLPEQKQALIMRSEALKKLGRPDLVKRDQDRLLHSQSSLYKDTMFQDDGKRRK